MTITNKHVHLKTKTKLKRAAKNEHFDDETKSVLVCFIYIYCMWKLKTDILSDSSINQKIINRLIDY